MIDKERIENFIKAYEIELSKNDWGAVAKEATGSFIETIVTKTIKKVAKDFGIDNYELSVHPVNEHCEICPQEKDHDWLTGFFIKIPDNEFGNLSTMINLSKDSIISSIVVKPSEEDIEWAESVAESYYKDEENKKEEKSNNFRMILKFRNQSEEKIINFTNPRAGLKEKLINLVFEPCHCMLKVVGDQAIVLDKRNLEYALFE